MLPSQHGCSSIGMLVEVQGAHVPSRGTSNQPRRNGKEKGLEMKDCGGQVEEKKPGSSFRSPRGRKISRACAFARGSILCDLLGRGLQGRNARPAALTKNRERD